MLFSLYLDWLAEDRGEIIQTLLSVIVNCEIRLKEQTELKKNALKDYRLLQLEMDRLKDKQKNAALVLEKRVQ